MWHDPDDRLQKAIDRFEEGDVATARGMLKSLDRQGVISPRIDLYLGHCHLDDDRPRAALRRYRRALALEGGAVRATDAQAWIGIALCHGRLGNLARAVEALGRAETLEPNREEVHCHLVHCHGLLGDLEKAEAHARQAVREDPTCPHVYRHLAVAYLLAGRPAPALAAWLEVRRLEPEHPELDLGLARAYAALGRRAEARRHYARALEGALAADAHAGLGELAMQEARVEEAAAHYQDALACDPEHVESRLRLAEGRAETGRLAEAWAILQPLAPHWEGADGPVEGGFDPEVVAVAARIRWLQGRRGRALRLLRAARRRHPASGDLACRLGELLLEMGRPGVAVGVLAPVVRRTRRGAVLDVDATLPARLLARALGRVGQRRAAVRLLAATAWRHPGASELYLDGAAALLACARPAAAERMLARGIARRPDSATLWAGAAELALESGRDAVARDRLREALRRDRRSPEALALLVRWLIERGAWRKALAAARAACRVLPADHVCVRHQGEAFLALGRGDEAVLALRRYVLAAPGDPRGYRLLAGALEATGNAPAARLQERLAALV